MTSNSKIIMGIDPGLGSTGVGVVCETGERSYRFLYSNSVLTKSSTALPERLEKIHRLVVECIDTWNPEVISIESIFFARNVRSAVMMAHGRGVAILAAAEKKIELKEYSPLEIKQSVVGKGRASKDQVEQMVKLLLNLKADPKNEHESDALACALCHAFRSAAQKRLVPGKLEAEESGLREGTQKESAFGGLSMTREELLGKMVQRGRRRRR
jgi:crossover junction endodeoxyribonuclease RuvC